MELELHVDFFLKKIPKIVVLVLLYLGPVSRSSFSITDRVPLAKIVSLYYPY
jgi:hypothetical protein